ncbi:MAG: hypothetical protein U0167_14710 [bacterium]
MPRRCLPLFVVSFLLALPGSAPARVWTVRSDGTGDAPTIAAALGAAVSGDVIRLAGGTYHEHDLELVDGVSLEGPSLDPAGAVIDAGGLGRVMRGQGIGTGTLLQGLTLTGGRVEGTCSDPGTGTYCVGGGALILGSAPTIAHCKFLDDHAQDNGGGLASAVSAPTLTDCRFEGNTARHGAAITFIASSLNGVSPTVTRCEFVGNTAGADGGAVYCYVSEPALSLCTFDANTSGEQGSSMFWYDPSPPVLDRCVFAFGLGTPPIFSGLPGGCPSLSCCDVYGNAGGDWIDCLAGQDARNGNFSADPLFCGAASLDVTLRAGSPCTAPGPTGCGAIGAEGVACAGTAAPSGMEVTTWGRLKAAHRVAR